MEDLFNLCTNNNQGIALAAFITSVLGTRLMIWVGIIDMPTHRSSHKRPTPRAGGIGAILGFMAALVLYYIQGAFDPLSISKLLLLMIAVGLLTVVSLRDDIKALPALPKLITQALTASLIVTSGLSIETLAFKGLEVSLTFGYLGHVIGIIWVVFFINVYNFMDGLDGLAAGNTFIASGFLSYIAYTNGSSLVFILSFSVLWSIAGFFIYNFPKARIFLGDVGSQFFGLVLAVLGLLTMQPLVLDFSPLTLPLLFLSFIYDVMLTLCRRILNKQPVFKAHRTHLFQLLNRAGLSHAQVSFIYMAFTCCQGIGAIYLQHLTFWYQLLLFVPYLLLLTLYTIFVQTHTKRKILKDQ